MKACSTCSRIYPDEAGFCPSDGQPLLAYEQVPVQTSADDRLVGTTICGRYEIRRIVADGGMGRVYEARDASVVEGGGRRVAIKVLHPDVARDSVAVERFKREFDISKELPHEHIVDVLDFQQLDDRFVMVMEYLEGEELRTLLQREKTVAPARLLRIFSQVAIGLGAAHQKEIVHRDLKPDNIFLCGTPEGDRVKLLDFGSVRLNKNRAQSKLTSMGTTIGSPYYMSPEQAEGSENLDQRADVFALGAIAYEALVGEVPFTGASGPMILLAILTKTALPVSTRTQGLPPALDDVIEDALAKKPDMRTASATAFADAMGRAFALEGSHVDWANMPLGVLEQQIEEKRSVWAGHVAVADPFAVANDPFAGGDAAQQGVSTASDGSAPMDPRLAMDAAFASVEQAAGVPKRSALPYVLLALVAVAVIVGIIALIVSHS